MKSNPNILVYDLNGPAGESIRASYGLVNLDILFNNRFIKTYTLDNDLLYNKINIYYNKYVEKNYLNRVVEVQNCKTVSEYFTLEMIDLANRPYTDRQELKLYIEIRNMEEGSPFTKQKLDQIHTKANYLLKTLDKASAMSYTNSMFRDQVWNKDFGFHDIVTKQSGQTSKITAPETRSRAARRTPTRSSGGGRSSY